MVGTSNQSVPVAWPLTTVANLWARYGRKNHREQHRFRVRSSTVAWDSRVACIKIPWDNPYDRYQYNTEKKAHLFATTSWVWPVSSTSLPMSWHPPLPKTESSDVHIFLSVSPEDCYRQCVSTVDPNFCGSNLHVVKSPGPHPCGEILLIHLLNTLWIFMGYPLVN